MKKLSILILFLSSNWFCFSQSNEFITLAQNQNVIWDMEWVGEDSILFTQLDGEVKLLDIQSQTVSAVHSISDLAKENQAGLMGMQLAHNFSDSRLVYLAYAFYGENFSIFSRISTFQYDPLTPKLSNESIIVDSIPAKNANLGGRLLVDSNFIYFTSGDLQTENMAQDLASLAGKILRYNLDGSIPIENPFSNSPIFTYGHRNPQGICKTNQGKIIISEHGPFNNDEVNVLIAGRNYGWPLVGGFKEPANTAIYDQYNIKQPIAAYTPTIAPAGIAYYGQGLFSSLQNSVIVASLKDKAMHVLHLSPQQDTLSSQERISLEPIGRIRDVLVSPDGRIFASTSNRDIFGEPSSEDDKVVELLEPFWLGTVSHKSSAIEINHFKNGFQVSGLKENAQLSVFDITGKALMYKPVVNHERFEMGNKLLPGMYVVVLRTKNKTTSFKLLIQQHD